MQKYFLIAITNNNKEKYITSLNNTKLSSKLKIDKYTSNKTYKELIDQIEKEYHLKPNRLVLKYTNEDKTYYYGLIINNKEFNQVLENGRISGKDNHITNNYFIEKELYKLLNSDLSLIERIYGKNTSIYAKICNYKENNTSILESIVKEEFSKYINVRKWLTRDFKSIVKDNDEKQITLFETFPQSMSTTKSRKNLLEKLKEDLQQEGKRLIAQYYNEDEEFLTPDDFEGIKGILDGIPNKDRYKSTNNKNKSKKRKK